MLKKEAQAITGGLSKPGKMPGPSFSTSAFDCQTGSRLANVDGSVCSDCYARKGNYQRYGKAIRAAQDRRMDGIHKALSGDVERAAWIDAMAKLIGKHEYFRWHDAGDLQSLRHFELLVQLAERLPNVAFWLPTKEPRFVKRFTKLGGVIPANLVVRVSAPMIDQIEPNTSASWNTSTVHSGAAPVRSGTVVCEANTRGGICGECRACWNPDIENISYPQH